MERPPIWVMRQGKLLSTAIVTKKKALVTDNYAFLQLGDTSPSTMRPKAIATFSNAAGPPKSHRR